MLAFLDPLRELTIISVLFRFFLSSLCGAVIGFERSKNRHAAGLRTHIVVCIGSASVMILSQYLLTFFNSAGDPARLGAQVISGIGFLGVGTIIVTGDHGGQHIRGLTTAAGLWASACMGLVIGSGYFEAAVMMCAFLFFVIALLNRVDAKYLKDAARIRFYIEYSSDIPFSTILSALRAEHWHMTHFEMIGNNNNNPTVSVIVDVQKTGPDATREKLLPVLRSVVGVLFVEDA